MERGDQQSFDFWWYKGINRALKLALKFGGARGVDRAWMWWDIGDHQSFEFGGAVRGINRALDLVE